LECARMVFQYGARKTQEQAGLWLSFLSLWRPALLDCLVPRTYGLRKLRPGQNAQLTPPTCASIPLGVNIFVPNNFGLLGDTSSCTLSAAAPVPLQYRHHVVGRSRSPRGLLGGFATEWRPKRRQAGSATIAVTP
jgi:hypothetical protein